MKFIHTRDGPGNWKTYTTATPTFALYFPLPLRWTYYRGESDLSRRVISYYLPGLSFREYIILNNTIEFSPITLEEIVQSHRRISLDTTNQFQPLPIFKDYLQYGYLPIILEGKDSYLPKISQIIMIPTYHIFSHITQEQPQK